MVYRGDEYLAHAVAQVKLEIFSDDGSVEGIIEVVGTIAMTEWTKECRVFVLPFLEAC